jgi:hypothetical protein
MKNNAKRQSFMRLLFLLVFVLSLKLSYFYIICNHQASMIQRSSNHTVFEKRMIVTVSGIVL